MNLGNVDNGNQDDFASATTRNELYTADGYLSSILFVSMGNFIGVIERVADARAENAAEINRLNTTSALLVQNQTNLEAAHGRIMDADIARVDPDGKAERSRSVLRGHGRSGQSTHQHRPLRLGVKYAQA